MLFEPLIVLLATGVAALANFATQFLLARTLGPAEFGSFISALALVTLVAPLAGFGLGSWWLRVFAEEGYVGRRWVKPSFSFLFVSTVASMLALLIWAGLGPHDKSSKTLLVILTGVVLAQATIDLVSAKLQLQGHYRHLALWQLNSHPTKLTGILILIGFSSSPSAFQAAMVFLGSAIFVVILGLPHFKQLLAGNLILVGHGTSGNVDDAKIRRDRPTLRSTFSRSAPFGLESFLFLVYYQTDVVLLRYLVGEETAGLYSVGVMVMAAAYLFPSVLYQKLLLSKIHRWAYKDPLKLTSFLRTGSLLIVLIGVIVTVFFWQVAPYFVRLIFGPSFEASISILTLLVFAIPFRYLASHLGSVLSTRNFIWINLKITAITAVSNVILNLLLIPEHGAPGAAVATIISHAMLALLFAITVAKKLPNKSPNEYE